MMKATENRLSSEPVPSLLGRISLVDLVEAHVTGDHEVKLEQAVHVKVDKARHVDAETV